MKMAIPEGGIWINEDCVLEISLGVCVLSFPSDWRIEVGFISTGVTSKMSY